MVKFIVLHGEAMIIPTLEVNRKYWEMEIGEEDWDKAAFTSIIAFFVSMKGRLKLKRPRTFQGAIDALLTKVEGQFSRFHSYDIVIFSGTLDGHIDDI